VRLKVHLGSTWTTKTQSALDLVVGRSTVQILSRPRFIGRFLGSSYYFRAGETVVHVDAVPSDALNQAWILLDGRQGNRAILIAFAPVRASNINPDMEALRGAGCQAA
jgi:hypothetical protein